MPGDSVRTVLRRAVYIPSSPKASEQPVKRKFWAEPDLPSPIWTRATLSGGWRKRLALAEALVGDPDILLLDEPTNHMDMAGIEWLEKLIQNSRFASVVISHDRYFLENAATAMAELNRVYPDGLLRVSGNYSAFLSKKSEFLAAQAKHQESLENRVRTELEWLRRGPKARATKAKARIDNAHELIAELKDLNARSRSGTADIDFTATDRKTKRLIELKSVARSFRRPPRYRRFQFGYYGRSACRACRCKRQRKNDLTAAAKR